MDLEVEDSYADTSDNDGEGGRSGFSYKEDPDAGLSQERPLPMDLQAKNQNPTLKLPFKSLAPGEWFLNGRLSISLWDWAYLDCFLKGQDIPDELHPNQETFKKGPKDYSCPVEDCNWVSTSNFKSARGHTRRGSSACGWGLMAVNPMMSTSLTEKYWRNTCLSSMGQSWAQPWTEWLNQSLPKYSRWDSLTSWDPPPGSLICF